MYLDCFLGCYAQKNSIWFVAKRQLLKADESLSLLALAAGSPGWSKALPSPQGDAHTADPLPSKSCALGPSDFSHPTPTGLHPGWDWVVSLTPGKQIVVQKAAALLLNAIYKV